MSEVMLAKSPSHLLLVKDLVVVASKKISNWIQISAHYDQETYIALIRSNTTSNYKEKILKAVKPSKDYEATCSDLFC